jgi:chromosome segregation ATPase
MVIQTENDQLKKEVMELKEKVLQVTKEKKDLVKEKDELTSQISVQEPLAIVQPIDANELDEFMAQVSLKEKEISQLVQEKKQLEKSNKEKQEKIDRLKGRLMGKEVLKSAQHSLWDLISIEVSKFWKELRRMEVKKAYIYSALDKHKLATEQLVHLHKTPTERAFMSITFLKYSSDEALQAFKINDRYQTIMLL